jgi:pyridoxal 5'-phosphate synthase pdxT subunit
LKIGVLALQGAFREHRLMLERCGVEVIEVRKAVDVDSVAGLVIPGGESTTIGKMLVDWGLMDKIKSRAAEGMAVYGTCAGMILLAKDIVGSQQPRLGLLDVSVQRNAFGRQRESFEADLYVEEFGEQPLWAVFIRAPYIESAGVTVKVLAAVDEHIVIARQGKILVTAFHPELTQDDRIHRYFIDIVKDKV